ncbi:MAG TPA: hypothetical protein DCP90_04185 [Clostridiales bacterium]|nr:MAG: hypothetical protein A2Y22_03940 [Clostridiales bacterium GWD2_32_59]HAN09794.1 hypothetical protein [Clostridiales bacterium]
MDNRLLKEVKKLVADTKIIYESENGKVNDEKEARLFVNKSLNSVVSNATILYTIKESFIKDDIKHLISFDELMKLIVYVINLTIHLERHQDYNIYITNKNLLNTDKTSYFIKEKDVYIPTNELFVEDSLIYEQLKHKIYDLIHETKIVYVEAFGVLESKEHANILINNEYEHATRYLNELEYLKELLYEYVDNYEPMISTMQSIIYELVQLAVVLDQSLEFYVQNNIRFNINKNANFYFVIMDGKDSTLIKNYEAIENLTNLLNRNIKNNNKLSEICRFRYYKQDEVHGIIYGEQGAFLDEVKNTYTENGVDMWVGIGTGKMDNIEKSVFGNPFGMIGEPARVARKEMEKFKIQSKQDAKI